MMLLSIQYSQFMNSWLKLIHKCLLAALLHRHLISRRELASTLHQAKNSRCIVCTMQIFSQKSVKRHNFMILIRFFSRRPITLVLLVPNHSYVSAMVTFKPINHRDISKMCGTLVNVQTILIQQPN